MFVHREEVYDQENKELKGIADLISGKHRNGEIGEVPLTFRGGFCRFENRANNFYTKQN